MKQALLGFVLVLFIGGFVWFLRSQTMSTDTPESATGFTEVVVRARTRGEPLASVLPLTRAQVDVCRIKVDSNLVQTGFREIATRTFRFVVTPALNESDQVELAGCLQDLRIQHLQLQVVRLAPVAGPQPAAASAQG